MIGWEDVYKVVVAMVPLYIALMLGYGSVKWWQVFTVEQCEAINRLVCYFTLPLFTFEFTAHVDPFKMNYLMIGADAISKVVIVLVLACWAKCSNNTSYSFWSWSITIFSLSTLTNSLQVVGVPLLKAMYGHMAVDLVVQSSVFQALIWLTGLLFILEIRRTRNDYYSGSDTTTTAAATDIPKELDLEQYHNDHHQYQINNNMGMMTDRINIPPSIWTLTKAVWLKLAMNPNSYACIIGITWAFSSKRWNFQMPSIMEGSILILSRAGTGTAMFSMGLFTALQEKVIACGASLTVFGLALRFIAGPLAMAIGSLAVGLQWRHLTSGYHPALPQSITSFIFAKQYGLHADVLSTAVIFGMIVSLPVLIGYYAILEFIH